MCSHENEFLPNSTFFFSFLLGTSDKHKITPLLQQTVKQIKTELSPENYQGKLYKQPATVSVERLIDSHVISMSSLLSNGDSCKANIVGWHYSTVIHHSTVKLCWLCADKNKVFVVRENWHLLVPCVHEFLLIPCCFASSRSSPHCGSWWICDLGILSALSVALISLNFRCLIKLEGVFVLSP